ncbi:hypothetical protein DFJ73DRAFT_857556, partial [Zopfochytrium polystomum]
STEPPTAPSAGGPSSKTSTKSRQRRVPRQSPRRRRRRSITTTAEPLDALERRMRRRQRRLPNGDRSVRGRGSLRSNPRLRRTWVPSRLLQKRSSTRGREWRQIRSILRMVRLWCRPLPRSPFSFPPRRPTLRPRSLARRRSNRRRRRQQQLMTLPRLRLARLCLPLPHSPFRSPPPPPSRSPRLPCPTSTREFSKSS